MVKRSSASKFPVARIKKIMQADEDVGKVAQATPVVISKALELFLADIVNATANETRKRGAKKVTAYHLKRAVHETQTLDFLKDIVEKIADPVGGDMPAAPNSTKKRRDSRQVAAAPASAAAAAVKQDEDDDDDDEQDEEDEEEDGADDDDGDGDYDEGGRAGKRSGGGGSNKRVKRE